MTRNAIALLMIDSFDVFAQVSKSCSDGRHPQDVQAVSPIILVVRTNVGYAVIAKYIVQHEDMTSITEAMSILRKSWDKEGINIGNFMIDCQQSEENAICVVFPGSGVYLCAFHRLHAWFWWIVNTKNGVSNYQTYCMRLLRAVWDAKMEDAYTKALMDLQKSPHMV